MTDLELREAIATKVMGWEKRSTPNGAEYFVREGVDVSHEELPHYELTWNDAALVVERMRELGHRLHLDAWGKDQYTASFGRPQELARCGTAPLAICLAALAALSAEESNDITR